MMTTTTPQAVTVLGLGAMGRALAARLLATGHRVTVWNRTPGRAAGLDGAAVAPSVRAAVDSSPLLVVCLLDDAAVREQLDPVVDDLAGRTLVNLTTTTPGQARDLSARYAPQGVAAVDGGIMATPDLIGRPEASVLYSGDEQAVEQHRTALGALGTVRFVGADPGAAALYDTAMLGAMYAMFAGFAQGGRLVRTGGGTAAHLAELLTPFLQAMTASFPVHALEVDAPGTHMPEQSDEFTAAAIDLLATSMTEAGESPRLLTAARELLVGEATG